MRHEICEKHLRALFGRSAGPRYDVASLPVRQGRLEGSHLGSKDPADEVHHVLRRDFRHFPLPIVPRATGWEMSNKGTKKCSNFESFGTPQLDIIDHALVPAGWLERKHLLLK